MASQADLELAKRLLTARVLSKDIVRTALAQQAELREQGRTYSLERILYARKDLPRGSLAVLAGPPIQTMQPFAEYEVLRELGDGGSATVYEAIYKPNGVRVAIKVLDPVHALRKDFLERFQHEARMLTELEHDHIILGYEIGFEGGYHFFSMDLVDGMTVLEVIDRRGFLSREESLSITAQAADALEYLHAAGYLHRDVKPSNIMIDTEGRARLIDLGLVRDLSSDEPGAGGKDTMTVGTVEYLSPEQARGRADLDARADIYSLGVTLYHMIVGEVPFEGETDYEVMAKQIMSAMDTQKVKQRRIPAEIHFFIAKMTDKDRDNRFATVPELRAALAGYVSGETPPVDFGPDPEPEAPPTLAPIQAPPTVAPVGKPIAKPIAPVAPVVQPAAPQEKSADAPRAPAPKPVPSPAPTRKKGSAPTPTRRRRR